MRGLAGSAECECLIEAIENASALGIVRRGELFAMRNLLRLPAVRSFAGSDQILQVVESVIGAGAFPVRGILFNKTPLANWNVVWHQDLMIPVRERRAAEGFGSWSTKAGVVHVQPPQEVLAGMLTVRLHLDRCVEQDGALRLLPGSHALGRLNDVQIDEWRSREPEIPELEAGDALLMRPLILHASSASESGNPRRVLHLEFAASDLPGGLEWAHEREVGPA